MVDVWKCKTSACVCKLYWRLIIIDEMPLGPADLLAHHAIALGLHLIGQNKTE